MAIVGGSYIDHFIRKFTDMLTHDLQQNGSRLRGTVTVEVGMGDKVYFDKIGAMSSYIHTTRNEPKQIATQTYERRFCTPTTIEFNTTIDMTDLVRYVQSPQSDLVLAGTMELGRQMDDIIIAAVGGTANREINGAASNVSFPGGQQIAVNVNTYTGLSSNTFLHEGKLMVAKRILQAAWVDMDREEIFVIAPAKQLAGLQSRATNTSNAGFLFRNLPDINLPGLDRGLDGFLGLRFVASELTGLDGSNNQYVYVYPKSAIKLGIWKDIEVDVHRRFDLAGNPPEITANMTIGAVRMFEEKVVQIVCDPT